ncbi:ComEC/Rec2 family competence protein [Helicobacter aurati]|uniref:ComEC/Rec2 family competence protein n=1 Tax=Helicobacter aurati TaxID=137778 RepID=A0A3D8J8K0_9HELI|nr:ComEC/Rec2 family competence protein [Helicobacter aurati]
MQNIYYINTRHSKTAYFRITIPPKHYFYLILCCLSILCINLYNKYQIYKQLQNGRSFEARIVNHYPKPQTHIKNKSQSEIFKFQDTFGNTYYGTYRGRFKNLQGIQARIYGKIYHCSFWQFFKGCKIYHSSFDIIPTHSVKARLTKFVESQHQNALIANLYNALFFAETLHKQLREIAIALGISHLIAISGLHLGVLLAAFFLCITPLYFLVHKHFFCYRNAMYDLSCLGLLFGFAYLILIDFHPSFLRAYIMACIGFFMLYHGITIFNMTNLFLCVLCAIALNPNLLCNIGFILSISGVFYIFLFIRYITESQKTPTTDLCKHHAKKISKASQLIKLLSYSVLLTIIIFLQMMPIVHVFFPYFSLWQLISIPLSIIFPLVFPLLICIHIITFGSLFDSLIESIISNDFFLSQVTTPLWILIPYILLSLLAIRYKWAYVINLCVACGFYIYNVIIFIHL